MEGFFSAPYKEPDDKNYAGEWVWKSPVQGLFYPTEIERSIFEAYVLGGEPEEVAKVRDYGFFGA